MSFTIDPTLPPDTGESATLGATRIRNVTTWLLGIFGLASTITTVVTAPVVLDPATGNVIFNGTVGLQADPTTSLQAATKQYVDNGVNFTTFSAPSTSGNPTVVATLAPAPASLVSLIGKIVKVTFSGDIVSASTLNVNGFGAKTLRKNGIAITASPNDI